MSGTVEYPSQVSPAARDLIGLFLTKEPAARLGNTPDGLAAIKRHAFFAGIDWSEMERMPSSLPAALKARLGEFKYPRLMNFDLQPVTGDSSWLMGL